MTTEDTRQALGVDIDNVVSVTDPAIRKTIHEVFGIHLAQEQIVYYQYHRCGITKEQEERVLKIFRDVTCSELDVVPGAIESLELLKQKYQVVLVTSRHPDIVEKTKDWLRLKNIPHDLLIFNNLKHQTGHNFNFFIEDNADAALSLAEAGIQTFLFDYPWNRSLDKHPNITRISGWQEVVAALNS